MTTNPRYVLIIEDNVHHAELLTEILDRHFAPVIIHTVDTFDDGIDFMAQSQYDLILTDGFTGDDSITAYADDIVAKADGAPIIVITGRGDEHLAAKLSKKGVSEYLVKTRETLDALPRILTKHFKRRTRRPRAEKLSAVAKDVSPTPHDLVREMEAIKEHVLRLASTVRRWRKTGKRPDLKAIDAIQEHLTHIRTLAEKI